MRRETVFETDKRRVCWVVSSPLTIRAFLKNHLTTLSTNHHVTVVANGESRDAALDPESEIAWVRIRLERKIHPILDTLAVFTLCREFSSRRFTLVQSVTPKAGLLAMTAAWLAGVPIRLHWFTGQVWHTKSGLTRALLKQIDRWIARVSTHLLVDSPSQRNFLVEHGVAPKHKMTVLAEGSICGVDVKRFRPDPAKRATLRERLGIHGSALVFLFVGRCTVDKGLLDLAEAFNEFCAERDDAYLVVCGPDEEGVVPRMVERSAQAGKRLIYEGATARPEDIMTAADVFCLPSYREGFGQVVIEAAASGLPCIASRIYGVVDAVVDGTTGLLHEPHNPVDILDKMRRLSQNPQLRSSMGTSARSRAQNTFNQEAVTRALMDYYAKVLNPCPADS